MKLGFFTDHQVQTSETFIRDLILGLEKEIGSDHFFHIVGNRSGQPLVENTVYANFSVKRKWLKAIRHLERIFNLKWDLTFQFRRSLAEKALNKLSEQDLPEVAYFEFGQPAILFRRYLASKNIPMVVHFHGMDASSAFNSQSYEKEINEVFNYAEHIITASHHIKRLLVLRGCSPKKISVIRYGIKVADIIPVSWEERSLQNPSVVFLGRLTDKKNPIALIHAFDIVKSKVPNAKLTVIGDGPLHYEVQDRINTLDLSDSVELLGEMAHKPAMEVLKNHWVYAQHSVTAMNGDQEGFAISPAEAAAYELAVVSTLHNGIPEHVIDGVTGYLVREFDYESMAEKIIHLLENKDLSQELGENGRKNILGLNDPVKRIESVRAILQLAYQKRVKVELMPN